MYGHSLNLMGWDGDINVVGENLSRSYLSTAKSKPVHRHGFMLEPYDDNQEDKYQQSDDPMGKAKCDGQ